VLTVAQDGPTQNLSDRPITLLHPAKSRSPEPGLIFGGLDLPLIYAVPDRIRPQPDLDDVLSDCYMVREITSMGDDYAPAHISVLLVLFCLPVSVRQFHTLSVISRSNWIRLQSPEFGAEIQIEKDVQHTFHNANLWFSGSIRTGSRPINDY